MVTSNWDQECAKWTETDKTYIGNCHIFRYDINFTIVSVILVAIDISHLDQIEILLQEAILFRRLWTKWTPFHIGYRFVLVRKSTNIESGPKFCSSLVWIKELSRSSTSCGTAVELKSQEYVGSSPSSSSTNASRGKVGPRPRVGHSHAIDLKKLIPFLISAKNFKSHLNGVTLMMKARSL